MAYDDAIKAGALAFFGDKYGDRVRVVRMGDFSVELCGGTHVNRTGDIGIFKLEAESGVAAGVRRVEAFTGRGALESIRRREKILRRDGRASGRARRRRRSSVWSVCSRAKRNWKRNCVRSSKSLPPARARAAVAENVREANGVKVVTRKVEGVEASALREMADRMRDKYGSAVVAIGSVLDGNKAALIVAVTADLAKKIKAGDIVKKIAPIIGGSGGGRPDFAQAGGHNAAKLDEALDQILTLV